MKNKTETRLVFLEVFEPVIANILKYLIEWNTVRKREICKKDLRLTSE